jgi:hypothetical protein
MEIAFISSLAVRLSVAASCAVKLSTDKPPIMLIGEFDVFHVPFCMLLQERKPPACSRRRYRLSRMSMSGPRTTDC